MRFLKKSESCRFGHGDWKILESHKPLRVRYGVVDRIRPVKFIGVGKRFHPPRPLSTSSPQFTVTLRFRPSSLSQELSVTVTVLPITVGQAAIAAMGRVFCVAFMCISFRKHRELLLGQRINLGATGGSSTAVALAACEVKINPDCILKCSIWRRIGNSAPGLTSGNACGPCRISGIAAVTWNPYITHLFRERGVIRIGTDPEDMGRQAFASTGLRRFRHVANRACFRGPSF